MPRDPNGGTVFPLEYFTLRHVSGKYIIVMFSGLSIGRFMWAPFSVCIYIHVRW
jgi:hypothetical protein